MTKGKEAAKKKPRTGIGARLLIVTGSRSSSARPRRAR